MSIFDKPLVSDDKKIIAEANRLKANVTAKKTQQQIIGKWAGAAGAGAMTTIQSSPKGTVSWTQSWLSSLGVEGWGITSAKMTVTNGMKTPDNPFLDSKNRGVIKLTKSDSQESIMLYAEDVTVEKKIPIKTQDTFDGTTNTSTGTTGVGAPSGAQTGASSDTGAGTGQQQQEVTTFVIKFKMTITKKGLTRKEFKEKRANYLFGYEDQTFTLTSDMFKKAMDMQFTGLQYVIPAGEENAYYQVELTQITSPEEKESDAKKAAADDTLGRCIEANVKPDATQAQNKAAEDKCRIDYEKSRYTVEPKTDSPAT